MKHLTWMILAAALAFGCDEKTEDPAAEEATGEAADEVEQEAAEVDDEAADDEIVTPEDFEEEASEAITQDNLEDEVARLEEALREELGE